MVRSVVIERGTIETDTVVCAAGVWSPAIARTAGVELPVAPVLREVVTTAPVEGLATSIPLTVDFSTGFYFHREGLGLLIGMADRAQPAGFDGVHGSALAGAGNKKWLPGVRPPFSTWASHTAGRGITR